MKPTPPSLYAENFLNMDVEELIEELNITAVDIRRRFADRIRANVAAEQWANWDSMNDSDDDDWIEDDDYDDWLDELDEDEEDVDDE